MVKVAETEKSVAISVANSLRFRRCRAGLAAYGGRVLACGQGLGGRYRASPVGVA